MKFKARVTMKGSERKIIEIPKSVRDNFESGNKYNIEIKEVKQ